MSQHDMGKSAEKQYPNLLDRIVRIPGVCGGAPIVRGYRMPVYVMLGMIASGDDWDELIAEGFPFLEREDFEACLLYAARMADTGYVNVEVKRA